MSEQSAAGDRADWRERLRVIIFEADTVAGKIFVLIFLIILSVVVVLLDSVTSIHQSHGDLLFAVDTGTIRTVLTPDTRLSVLDLDDERVVGRRRRVA